MKDLLRTLSVVVSCERIGFIGPMATTCQAGVSLLNSPKKPGKRDPLKRRSSALLHWNHTLSSTRRSSSRAIFAANGLQLPLLSTLRPQTRSRRKQCQCSVPLLKEVHKIKKHLLKLASLLLLLLWWRNDLLLAQPFFAGSIQYLCHAKSCESR